MRRGIWAQRQGEGWPVATGTATMMTSSARWCAREGSRRRDGVQGEKGEVQGGEGGAWHSGLAPEAAEAGGGSGACRRAVATRIPAYWQEVEDGGGCGGLGRWSWARWAAR